MKKMMNLWCGTFLGLIGLALSPDGKSLQAQELRPEGEFVVFGFSTSEWGKEWDLLQVIETLQELNIRQVEVAVNQASGITLAQTSEERSTTRDQFQDAEIEVLGLRANVAFESKDLQALATSVDQVRQQLRLSHDIGGSGVRVRIGDLKGDEESLKTVAKEMRNLGEYAIGFGQELRVEAEIGEGTTAEVVKLLKEVDHSQVKAALMVPNGSLSGKEVEEELKQLQPYLGSLILIGLQQEGDEEAFGALVKWLVEVDFNGVVVLSTDVENGDKALALGRQKVLWEQRLKNARKK